MGQIAKHQYGCRVIGTAGGPAKCAILKEMGFDAAIDYKACPDSAALEAAMRSAAGPGGLAMVFENVGGAHFEAAFKCLGAGGRIAVCGAISQYNLSRATPPTVAINQTQMIYTNQRIGGGSAVAHFRVFLFVGRPAARRHHTRTNAKPLPLLLFFHILPS